MRLARTRHTCVSTPAHTIVPALCMGLNTCAQICGGVCAGTMVPAHVAHEVCTRCARWLYTVYTGCTRCALCVYTGCTRCAHWLRRGTSYTPSNVARCLRKRLGVLRTGTQDHSVQDAAYVHPLWRPKCGALLAQEARCSGCVHRVQYGALSSTGMTVDLLVAV